MATSVVVATANVLCTLDAADARRALRLVLDAGPDLVGLQEWQLPRLRLLRESGTVRLVPAPGRLARRTAPAAGYLWFAPLVGGCAVGMRAERFEPVSATVRLLSPVRRGDRADRGFGIEPARVATVCVVRDREDGRTLSLVDFHLTPGVQARGVYREDRPRLVARHRREVRVLERLVAEQQALGHEVYAVGDSNVDGLRLAGLTSAWAGRPDGGGTLGPRRRVDDVHGPGPATSVTLLSTPSDHRAVLAVRPAGSPGFR